MEYYISNGRMAIFHPSFTRIMNSDITLDMFHLPEIARVANGSHLSSIDLSATEILKQIEQLGAKPECSKHESNKHITYSINMSNHLIKSVKVTFDRKENRISNIEILSGNTRDSMAPKTVYEFYYPDESNFSDSVFNTNKYVVLKNGHYALRGPVKNYSLTVSQ